MKNSDLQLATRIKGALKIFDHVGIDRRGLC